MRNQNVLFSSGNLLDVLRNALGGIQEEVDSVPEDQFSATPTTDMVEHIFSEMRVEPLQISDAREQLRMDKEAIKVDVSHIPGRKSPLGNSLVSGVRVTVYMAFAGNPDLWKLKPVPIGCGCPTGNVKSEHLEMVFERPDDQIDQIDSDLGSNLKSIRNAVDSQKEQVDAYNESLPDKIRVAVELRKKRLSRHDQLAEMLKIPLRRDPTAPQMKPIQIERRVVPQLKTVPPSNREKEWEIPSNEYEHILTIIRHEGRTYEALPKTFAAHPEPELRDIILAHLNGHYKGGATGETFRGKGKADIHIEMENRAAFIAECKIWDGAKTIASAVDQLFGYQTWRDCKTAIVVFNKTVSGFSALLPKTREALVGHPQFVRVQSGTDQGEWRCIFRSPEDAERLVFIHVFLFNLCVSEQSGSQAG